jgi:cell wall-associated NlpC family hydrolase
MDPAAAVTPAREVAHAESVTSAEAPAPPALLPEAARRRRLLASLSGVSLMALAACSSAPTRRSRPARAPDVEEEPDESEAGAAGPGSEVVLQALANVGKPYRWGGSHPSDGFDCSGLVAHVFDDALGMKLPRTSLQMSARGRRVDRARLAAGDLVFFNTSRQAYSHVGIYIGRGRFVHAPSSGSLVRVERMNNRYWSSRFDGARRLVSLD